MIEDDGLVRELRKKTKLKNTKDIMKRKKKKNQVIEEDVLVRELRKLLLQLLQICHIITSSHHHIITSSHHHMSVRMYEGIHACMYVHYIIHHI